MKGGINKIIRNIAATKGKSDFDKVCNHIRWSTVPKFYSNHKSLIFNKDYHNALFLGFD